MTDQSINQLSKKCKVLSSANRVDLFNKLNKVSTFGLCKK